MDGWISIEPEDEADARELIQGIRTLHDLVQAGGEVIEVVEQDEFTHDVVARVPLGRRTLLAVFDST